MEETALSRLRPYNACRVVSIAESPIRDRLEDMGVTPGTLLTWLFDAPCGDPVAFEVRGTVIAIRRDDAEGIKVQYAGLKE